jgi:hypothetical protein
MKGIDISSNNHQGEVFNFQQVKAAGHDFVYVKATQGINYTNPYLVGDVRDAYNAGLLVGIYHFYDAASGTPQEQADFFNRNGIHQPVGEGHTDLSQFLTLTPVLDFESVMDGTLRDEFITALARRTGVYMNHDYEEHISYGKLAAFGWLAWPEWTNELLPSVTAIVQTVQTQVQGIGENPNGSHSTTDNDTLVADVTTILDVAQPTTKKEEELMDSIEVNINGTPHIVSHVYTSNGHYLEVTRPVANLGKGATEGDSVIDLTDAYPAVTWH